MHSDGVVVPARTNLVTMKYEGCSRNEDCPQLHATLRTRRDKCESMRNPITKLNYQIVLTSSTL